MSEAKEEKQDRVITLSDRRYNADWLRSVPEQKAVNTLKKFGCKVAQIRNAWKQANGATVRNNKPEAKSEAK